MTPEKALKYDRRLSLKNTLDGTKIIYRSSPFNSQREHEIKSFSNIYLGSGRWIRDTLIQMDTQRNDIIHRALENNKKIRNKRNDDRIGRNVAEIFDGGGDTFIN